MIPIDWLSANITPVLTKGEIHLPENYRPVSLIYVSCKLQKHIICKHILDHLERNKSLTSLKHGFRSGYSCETYLVTTLHELLGKFDAGTHIDMVILYTSNVSDSVLYKKLLHKMRLYRVDGNFNAWLTDFLKTKKQQQEYEGGSAWHPRSLARTFTARSYKQWVKNNLQTESQVPGPSEWLGMRSWNLSWRNARRHKFAWRGPYNEH